MSVVSSQSSSSSFASAVSKPSNQTFLDKNEDEEDSNKGNSDEDGDEDEEENDDYIIPARKHQKIKIFSSNNITMASPIPSSSSNAPQLANTKIYDNKTESNIYSSSSSSSYTNDSNTIGSVSELKRKFVSKSEKTFDSFFSSDDNTKVKPKTTVAIKKPFITPPPTHTSSSSSSSSSTTSESKPAQQTSNSHQPSSKPPLPLPPATKKIQPYLDLGQTLKNSICPHCQMLLTSNPTPHESKSHVKICGDFKYGVSWNVLNGVGGGVGCGGKVFDFNSKDGGVSDVNDYKQLANNSNSNANDSKNTSMSTSANKNIPQFYTLKINLNKDDINDDVITKPKKNLQQGNLSSFFTKPPLPTQSRSSKPLVRSGGGSNFKLTEDLKVVVIAPTSLRAWWNKIRDVKVIVDYEMGFLDDMFPGSKNNRYSDDGDGVDSPSPSSVYKRQVKSTPSKGKGKKASSSSSSASTSSSSSSPATPIVRARVTEPYKNRTTLIMLSPTNRIIALLITERIEESYALIPDVVTVDADIGNNEYEFAKNTHKSPSPSHSTSNSSSKKTNTHSPTRMQTYTRSQTPHFSKLGIYQIWTHASHRSRSIASSLLQLACVINECERGEVAFSSPTEAGVRLMSNFCADSGDNGGGVKGKGKSKTKDGSCCGGGGVYDVM